jgi:nucleoside-diphosphate-sugar epimerase
LRPNLHIKDYADLCELLLEADKQKVNSEIFNCGYQNMSIMDIAVTVKKVVEEFFPEIGEIEIIKTESDDPRSYHISSEKIKKVLNYAPKYSVEDAVRDLCVAFKDGKLQDSFDDDKYFNVQRMKNLKVT